jgi:Flp pilus assembly protein CpaB
MLRGRALIFAFLIFIIIVIGAIGFLAFSQFSVPEEAPKPVSVEVYITLQPIPQGGEIRQEFLSTIKINTEDLATVMFTMDEQELLVGKTVRFPLDQGVVITESMVGNALPVPNSGPHWALLIPSGMTAISIPANRLGLASYSVTDGAHVNVNACFQLFDVDPVFQTILPNKVAVLKGTGFTGDPPLPVLTLGFLSSESAIQGRVESDPALKDPFYVVPSEIRQQPRTVCKILLQDAVVLQVGDFKLDSTLSTAATPTLPPDANQQASQAAVVAPNIITLIVSPQDSLTLSYLTFADIDLTLTLRSSSDQTLQSTEASTLQFLLSQYNIPIPDKLPNSLEPRFSLPKNDGTIPIPIPVSIEE